MSDLLNRQIAGQLEDEARRLERRGANRQHVHAFERAADSVRHWPISLALMYKSRGVAGLQEVPGVGTRIAAVIRALLTRERLLPFDAETHERDAAAARHPPVPVGELLDVDREYREKSAAGELPLIAPLRFNPGGDAWLPVLHTHRGSRQYTALFSNTENAHRWGRTRDWVVVYASDAAGEQQFTVVTAWHGPLRGERVVAGRERECARAKHQTAA